MNTTTTCWQADAAAQATALDGHIVGKVDRYNVVVSMDGNERHKSEALPIKEASKRLANIIRVYISDLGYKQTSYGDRVTLKKDHFEVKIQLVVANE